MSQHFIVIKNGGLDLSGTPMGGDKAARALLDARIWPLHKHTPCRNRILPSDRLVIYIAGAMTILAHTTVVTFRDPHDLKLPLLLDDICHVILGLGDVTYIQPAPTLRNSAFREKLSFVPRHSKWGVVVMAGARRISKLDFDLLIGACA